MWKYIIYVGVDYLRKYLLPKLHLNPSLFAFFELVLGMGAQAGERLTDSDPDNATQLKKLLAENYEELVTTLLVGGADCLPDTAAKLRVIAILGEASDRLRSTMPAKT